MKWRLSQLFFMTLFEIVWRIILIIIITTFRKKGLKLFVSYMWKKLCNLIARKFRKTRRFSLHDVWIVVFYFYILFLLSSLLYILSPHRTWNAHALAFSFVLSLFSSQCAHEMMFLFLYVFVSHRCYFLYIPKSRFPSLRTTTGTNDFYCWNTCNFLRCVSCSCLLLPPPLSTYLSIICK